MTALKAADVKADFGVRRVVASGRMLIGSKPCRAAAASEIYSPPKARFCSDLVRRRQLPQIVLDRLSLVLSLKLGIIWRNKQSIAI